MNIDATKPTLIFFSSSTEGRSRRAEGHLAQVLQRRQNHNTFLVQDRRVRGRLVLPRGCGEIQTFLAPWLR